MLLGVLVANLYLKTYSSDHIRQKLNKKKKKKIKIALKKTKKERRRRGRSLPRSRAQKSSEAGRRGGEGVRREEQRDEGQCERTDEFVSVCL